MAGRCASNLFFLHDCLLLYPPLCTVCPIRYCQIKETSRNFQARRRRALEFSFSFSPIQFSKFFFLFGGIEARWELELFYIQLPRRTICPGMEHLSNLCRHPSIPARDKNLDDDTKKFFFERVRKKEAVKLISAPF